ncbi:MAG TPA: ABC transporter ATP-binding protein [Solirubrobacterales bacterium]|nr:ABC transporter ATP-binding protein [Solirubrobacterales bacterium]
MPVDNAIHPEASSASRSPAVEGAPLAIQVEDVHKAFMIPTHRVDSLKERVVRPFSAPDYRELRALDGVSFEVHQGEFFGIVGRNGSGKSTLLKLLASIYRADAGTIRMAGRLAPFIELGVGFNQDLTARENIVLNGVMMGLSPREMRRRTGAIIEFAELEDFVDLKLKNYSSGMLVRLAFSVMMEADADVLLIDEVLAVGDAAFQQKCADAFREMKAQGKTIVLVTHEMATVEAYCHRAMLISEGRIQTIGDPGEVGRDYLRLNFEREGSAEAVLHEQTDDVRIVSLALQDAAGTAISTIEHGSDIRLRLELEALRDLPGIDVGFLVANADRVDVLNFGIPVGEKQRARSVAAGERVSVEARVENHLAGGRYFVHCGIYRAFEGGIALYQEDALDFLVFGGPETRGLVVPEVEIESSIGEGSA